MPERQKVSRLRMERISRGWTLKMVAAYLGVTEVTIHAWETGKTEPSVSMAFKLCKLYGKPVPEAFKAFFVGD